MSEEGERGLAVEGASLRLGRRSVLDGVTLRVAPGERLAVVGPNGAGKTCLARLMAGLVGPTRGRVILHGRPLHAAPARWRALRIAAVAQNDAPDLRLSLAESVALGRVPHRGRVPSAEHARAVASALDRVGLGHLAARRLDALSGGERQRGAIARAIAQEPELLILDEPTNHLDPRARSDVLDLARGLGVAVVAVLHDLALVAPFADRVAVLDRGRLVALAPPAEALSPAVVRAVFAMDSFTATPPGSSRGVMVFHAPQTA